MSLIADNCWFHWSPWQRHRFDLAHYPRNMAQKKGDHDSYLQAEKYALECKNYRGKKLLEHVIKIVEGILDKRLREAINIDELPFGFMPGRSKVDGIIFMRQLSKQKLWQGTQEEVLGPRKSVWPSSNRPNFLEVGEEMCNRGNNPDDQSCKYRVSQKSKIY